MLDDDADAREVAESIAEELSTRNRQVSLSVLPDPSLDYTRQTVALGIWDATGDSIAVGQYAVRSVSWSLTPTSGVQQMTLGRVDDAADVLQEVA